MTASNLANELLEKLGGVDKNNLNSVLQLDNKHDDQTETFIPSDYYDLDSE